jgi:HD-GYP domain-containing protein (c-di-GMP phosphodiesterase class II)
MEFFSINPQILPLNRPLNFDIYVNASNAKKTNFVKVFPGDEVLNTAFKEKLSKYPAIYVPESQRNAYLKTITNNEVIDDIKKSEVIKDTALHYLNEIYTNPSDEHSIIETISKCDQTVESMMTVIEDKSIASVKELIANLSFHDFYTYDHSINVSMYCIAIYKGIFPNANQKELLHVGMGGLLHDIGKLTIPTSIINKPGQLSDEEFSKIKTHPDRGYQMMGKIMEKLPAHIDWTRVLNVIVQHHENFDGRGYPYGKKGDEIDVMAKVCTIADIFDALTTKRSYNEVLSQDKAIEILATLDGKKLDPQLFSLFLQHMKTYVPEGKRNKVLHEKFDPSVPFKMIPYTEVEKEAPPEEDYGKIFTDEDKQKSA